MRMAFLHSSVCDSGKTGPMQLFYIARSTIAHACP
ncbi:hypothetical protein EVA_16889 [gut metagenome]|uniref:Uncharacterized protein n=1 Tax=gut metagenome TaxID=749906 RepID=J9G687_9ZZZZ